MQKELLMSYAEYRAKRHETPYVYTVQRGEQRLQYFGARHTFDPTDPQFIALEKFWTEFVTATKGQKRIVLLEGGNRPALATKDAAIREGGEMHYVAYLAAKENIQTCSPELPGTVWFAELLKQFSQEEIAYYDFARACYQ